MPKPKPKRKPAAMPDAAAKPDLILARERVEGVMRLLEAIQQDANIPGSVKHLSAGTLQKLRERMDHLDELQNKPVRDLLLARKLVDSVIRLLEGLHEDPKIPASVGSIARSHIVELDKDIQFQDQQRAQVDELISETTLERVRRTGDLRDVSYNDLRQEMQEERRRQEAAQLVDFEEVHKKIRETLDILTRDLQRAAASNSFPWVDPNSTASRGQAGAGANKPVEVPWLLACAIQDHLKQTAGAKAYSSKDSAGLADQLGACIKRQEEGRG